MQPCKTQKSEKTKTKILQTAVMLFSKSGFHGTKVDAIAAKANVNKERIYAYFGSKKALFENALAEVYAESAEYDMELLSLTSKDIPGITGKIVSHYMESYHRRPEFWRMISWANLEFSSLPPCIGKLKAKSLEHLKNIFLAGQRLGAFNKKLSFEAYIYGLWALTFFYHSNQKTLQESLSPELFEQGFESGPLAGLPELFQTKNH